jgi:hypothetical protein
MSNKQYKQIAKEALQGMFNGEGEDGRKIRINKDSVGLIFNEKGNFYSLTFELEFEQKGSQGSISINRNVALPINLIADVVVSLPEIEKEVKEEKPKRGRKALKVEEMENEEETSDVDL